MIVYKRKKKKLVIPCGLGPVVCVDPGYELQSKSVDPSTEVIDVIADASFYGLRNVTVNQVTADIDPYIQAGNIKRGVEILGVTGEFDGGPLQDKTVDSSTSGQVITPDGSNYGLGSVTVNPYVLDSKTVDPSTGQITVTSDADGLSSVTVNAAPLQSRTVDPSTEPLDIARTTSNWYGLNHVYINPVTAGIDSDIQAGNIRRGVEILGVEGTFDGGTLQSKTVDASTASQTVTPDASNYGLSSVTVNPYTVESKSDTITANGQFVYTPTGADALSSVTVDVSIKTAPYLQSKTVDSSTSSQSVTADSNYDGLSSVTVNPYVLDTKTVDPSVNVQIVTSDADGLSSVTVNAANLQSRTVDPSTVQLDIQRTSSDYYGLRHVYINAVTSAIDPDIQAGNIKRGVEILGVEGTFDGGTLQSKTVDSSTASQTVTADSSYYGLSSVTVDPYVLDTKTVDCSTGQQVITSDEDGLASVTVNAAKLQGRSYTPQRTDNTIYPNASNGYIGFNKVTIYGVTAAIDRDIQPENIKRGVEILGVTGEYDGGPLQSKIVDSSTASQTVTPDGSNYGLSSVTVNPYVLDSKTVNSSTVLQTITSSVDGLSSVTINPYVLDLKTVDSSTNPQTVISNVDGLAGVVVMPYVLDSKTVDSSTVSQTITSSEDGLSSVTVNPYTVESVTVSAATSAQVITPTNADAISSVTVNAAPLQNRTVDASTVQIQVSRSTADYYGLRTVTVNAVTSSIDSNIQAGNIKQGVTILGVAGTLEEPDYDSIYNALLEI